MIPSEDGGGLQKASGKGGIGESSSSPPSSLFRGLSAIFSHLGETGEEVNQGPPAQEQEGAGPSARQREDGPGEEAGPANQPLGVVPYPYQPAQNELAAAVAPFPPGPGENPPLPQNPIPGNAAGIPERETEVTSGNPTIPRAAGDEAGPSHQTAILHNSSLETSMRNRVEKLENEGSIFLLGKSKGAYWAEIKQALDQAPSQREYQRLLEFESRDLQIREQKHSCYSIFRQVLIEHPAFSENAGSHPQEAFLDFFDENREELDTHLEWSTAERDRRELLLLERVGKDISERGPDSIYMRKLLGYND